MDGYLAVGAEQLLVDLLSLAKGRDHGSRSNEGRCTLAEREQQKTEPLRLITEIDPGTAGIYGDVITADQGGRLMGVGGATDVLKQRCVVDVTNITFVEVHPAGEAGREKARADRIFEGLAHA
jgi:hypothetical protein